MPLLTLPNASSLALSVRAKALVFEDPKSNALLDRIRAVAPSQGTVLITGETGTGKELVARHIHDLSSRAEQPFLAVNCGALSEAVAEGELFGHEKDALAGRLAAKTGWFEAAQGGTLFLDEIGDLPLSAQAKLLRLLQERQSVRVGSAEPIAIDVRLIVATNVDLEQAILAGHFRRDLFYRLNVVTLALLPLRERPGDVLPLARHFIEVHSQRLGVRRAELSSEAAARLLEHPWPGNIRELENVIHHGLLLCHGPRITTGDLRLTTPQPKSGVQPASDGERSRLDDALLELFEQNPPNLYECIEQTVMRAAYRYCERNQLQTARLLGVSRNIVRARLIQFGEIPGSLRSLRAAAIEPSSAAEVPSRSSGGTVCIGYQRFGLLKLVRARGRLESELLRRSLSVEWVEFASGVALVEAFRRGEVGLGIVGEGPPVIAQAARVPIVYLAAEAPAPEGEAIIVPRTSGITRVVELRGKKVALSHGANVHYLLIQALEEAGVEYADVRIEFMAPTAARAAFEQGTIDAWVIGDPMFAEVQHSSGARVVRDARGLAYNPAYYVCTQDFAQTRPEVLQALLSELTSISRWAEDHLEEVVESLAPRLGMAKQALSVSLRRSGGARLLDDELMASQQRVADSFFKFKLIPRAISVADAAWSVPSARSSGIASQSF
jgi:aliphatic sulfonates family ABC transporter substrate-binding protein